MRRLIAPFLLAVVAAAFLAGWLAPAPTSPPDPAPARAPGIGAPIVPAGGDAAAVEELPAYIADDGSSQAAPAFRDDPAVSDEPAAPPPPPAYVPPPPPPPDVAQVFRREVTGVLGEPGGRLSVLLVNSADGLGVRRLRVGERFVDNWTLVGLTRDSAVLSDGERTRRIPFFGGPATGEGVRVE